MKKGAYFLKWIAGAIVFIVAFAVVTMMLWNWLVPVLFHGPEIRFVEALGLLLLTRILFGGWGKGGSWGGGVYGWKHRYQARLSAMSPEDRERFKARMREKWCSTPAKPTGDTVS